MNGRGSETDEDEEEEEEDKTLTRKLDQKLSRLMKCLRDLEQLYLEMQWDVEKRERIEDWGRLLREAGSFIVEIVSLCAKASVQGAKKQEVKDLIVQGIKLVFPQEDPETLQRNMHMAFSKEEKLWNRVLGTLLGNDREFPQDLPTIHQVM